MATATKEPKTVSTKVDTSRNYTYVLTRELQPLGGVFDHKNRPRPESKYQKRVQLHMASPINWPEDTLDPFSGKPREAGTASIRYYDGCTTLFVDSQPSDEKVLERVRQSTQPRDFIGGYLTIPKGNRMLKLFLDWSSQNGDSPFRVSSVEAKYKQVDAEVLAEKEQEEMDLLEEVLELAKNATESQMLVHCAYLGVDTIDLMSNVELSPKAIRAKYRAAAKADPKEFKRSFSDSSIQNKVWIERALTEGEILTANNRATWKKGDIILDISGADGREGIVKKLVDFSVSEAGRGFVSLLKKMYS